jgi:hypothetical protein
MKFILFTVLGFVAELLAYPLVPIAVLFADKDGRLPFIFRWLETFDALGWDGGWYEPAVFAVAQKHGKRAALIYWLWRNKAYTLRNWMRADVTDAMPRQQIGDYNQAPGVYYWRGSVGPYWQVRVGYGFSKFCLFAQAGWKIADYLNPNSDNWISPAAGMFIGITLRSTRIEK